MHGLELLKQCWHVCRLIQSSGYVQTSLFCPAALLRGLAVNLLGQQQSIWLHQAFMVWRSGLKGSLVHHKHARVGDAARGLWDSFAVCVGNVCKYVRSLDTTFGTPAEYSNLLASNSGGFCFYDFGTKCFNPLLQLLFSLLFCIVICECLL